MKTVILLFSLLGLVAYTRAITCYSCTGDANSNCATATNLVNTCTGDKCQTSKTISSNAILRTCKTGSCDDANQLIYVQCCSTNNCNNVAGSGITGNLSHASTGAAFSLGLILAACLAHVLLM